MHESAVSSDDIARQIELILESPMFVKSERMRALLRYLMEQSLHGSPERLKEYAIGVDVFGKTPSFDPRIDTTVRTEARRLRSKLGEYYRAAGEHDVVTVELPKGSYRLVFHPRSRRVPADATAGSVPHAAGHRRYQAAAAVLGVVLLLALGIWMWNRRAASGRPAIRSLVVLPIVNLCGDPSRQYLADGITDTLITDLAGISALRVASRASATSYLSRHKTAPEIGRELGVDAVIEGSMRCDGQRVRVNARLVLASTDGHLWAAAFERPERDVLQLESEITGAITREIRNVGPRSEFRRRPGTSGTGALAETDVPGSSL
jgi:TolB-like protein